jgi:hypothetical protein
MCVYVCMCVCVCTLSRSTLTTRALLHSQLLRRLHVIYPLHVHELVVLYHLFTLRGGGCGCG